MCFLPEGLDVASESIFRGCETWVVREGYEGLVRGNQEGHHFKPLVPILAGHVVTAADPSLVHNLRFGDGELLKDGTGDHRGGRSLKGRYIVRVGWDDVRGWFAEVRFENQIRSDITLCDVVGWDFDWDSKIDCFPNTRRSICSSPQSY